MPSSTRDFFNEATVLLYTLVSLFHNAGLTKHDLVLAIRRALAGSIRINLARNFSDSERIALIQALLTLWDDFEQRNIVPPTPNR